MNRLLHKYKCLTVTHNKVSLGRLRQFILPSDDNTAFEAALNNLKEVMHLDELMYMQTCNRVMYFFTTDHSLDDQFIHNFFLQVNPRMAEDISIVDSHEGGAAMRHLLEVASSLDSMVVGEREIHKQLRLAYEQCRSWGLTGDSLRVAVKTAIQTAKNVFTNTRISEKPVSVVSLAMNELVKRVPDKGSRFLIVGAGSTNNLVAKFLLKFGYSHFTVFNRTMENGNALAGKLNGQAFQLGALHHYKDAFDVLITCTGATEPVISGPLYTKMLNGDTSKKLIIDLAVPHDVGDDIPSMEQIDYLEIGQIKSMAKANLDFRRQEIDKASQLIQKELDEFTVNYQMRQVEVAMRGVSQDIRKIKDHAVGKVFSREISQLDPNSKELLDKVLQYMEKKYVSIPMTRAKEAFQGDKRSIT